MPGLAPGFHVSTTHTQDVNGRDKPGHDDMSRIGQTQAGGGRKMTSCLAESATTSGGFCSFMP